MNQITDKEYSKLVTKIDNLQEDIDKFTSWKRQIPQSIGRGILASFGATIVFAVILIILSQLIQSAEQVPILNDLIEKSKLEKVVDAYNDVEVEDNGAMEQ